jgi:hypothetical protein
MKNLLIAVALLFAAESNAFIGSVGKSTIKKYDGTVDQVEKIFINVKNVSGSTIAAGAPVTLDLTSDDGASVTTSVTSGLAPLCIMAVSCSANALCKCQTYGLFDSALFDSTNNAATAGARWYMSTSNAGYISARATSLATEVPGGIFYDAASASASVQIFINL